MIPIASWVDDVLQHNFLQVFRFYQDDFWTSQLAPDAAVIAVSSSGFTEGALKKAKARGVIPRDLQKLTDAEVQAWGKGGGFPIV